ncbi:MAG TPA: hypothetical protein VJ111_09410, partial [Chitinophagaceae bacterium]|nr:hypothetical protein [Chitinophagaceae bacterium]
MNFSYHFFFPSSRQKFQATSDYLFPTVAFVAVFASAEACALAAGLTDDAVCFTAFTSDLISEAAWPFTDFAVSAVVLVVATAAFSVLSISCPPFALT